MKNMAPINENVLI